MRPQVHHPGDGPVVVVDHGLCRRTQACAPSWPAARSSSSVGTVTSLAVRRSTPSAVRVPMTRGRTAFLLCDRAALPCRWPGSRRPVGR